MLIRVDVKDTDGTHVMPPQSFNLLSQRDRAWMGKVGWWAAHNGYSITTAPSPIGYARDPRAFGRHEGYGVPLFIWVETRDTDGNLVSEPRSYNLYDYEGRVWMARHSWWAMHEGLSVTTSPMDIPEERPEDRTGLDTLLAR